MDLDDDEPRSMERPPWVKIGLWGLGWARLRVGVLLAVDRRRGGLRRLRVRGLAILLRRADGVRRAVVLPRDPLGGRTRDVGVRQEQVFVQFPGSP